MSFTPVKLFKLTIIGVIFYFKILVINFNVLQYNTKLTAVDSAVNLKGERATFENEKYGSHQRNNFDIWLAKTDVPAPLVIYIHGGGFTGGDKSRYYGSEDLIRFLDAGVSVATVNYRFMTEAPFGIKASMNDVKRAVQYIRYNHKIYNIDKKKDSMFRRVSRGRNGTLACFQR